MCYSAIFVPKLHNSFKKIDTHMCVKVDITPAQHAHIIPKLEWFQGHAKLQK